MTSSDDFELQFEQRLRSYAAQAETRPGVEAVALAVAARSSGVGTRPNGAFQPRIRSANARARTLLLVAVLAVGLIGTALVPGSLPHGPVVAPLTSPQPPTSLATEAPFSASPDWPPQFGDNLCAGGTRLADIRDTTTPNNSAPRWVAAARPTNDLQGPRNGWIAVTADSPGGARVYLVDPSSSAACLLAELPPGVTVTDTAWAPAGDALAIFDNAGGIYVWSVGGTTRAFHGTYTPTFAWSPSGAWLALGDWLGAGGGGLWALPADGPPLRFSCEPSSGGTPRPELCPAFPHLVWSPDSQRIAIGGGDRVGLFGVASFADPTFRRLAVGPAINPADSWPLAWLDPQTILAVDQNGRLLEIPERDPSTYRIRTGLSGVLSPNMDRDAWTSADSLTVRVRDIASRRETVVFSATPVRGVTTTVENDPAWAPDGRSLVFAVLDSAGRRTLLVVNADGTGLRQLLVGRFGFSNAPTFPIAGAWQPVWP